jgi:Concanavalin A-like lectin/glucanases superfamily/Immunoglobulin domain/Immunoglobulin I-set domain
MRKALLIGLTSTILGTMAVSNARADYSNTVASFNPLGYWRLSENIQPPAADVATTSGSLGTGALGYYVGGSSHPVTGALVGSSDTAASFDGSGQVKIPYNPKLSLNAPFTVEAWFNPGATTSAQVCPLSCGHLGSPRSGWLIYQTSSGWNLRFYNENGTTTSLDITGGTAPVPGTWYHVAAVYTGTNATIYVNGAGTTGVPSGFVPNRDGGLTIGSRSDNSFYFVGSVDEVAVYTNVLTAAEILSHYQNGTNASPATPYNQLVQAKNPIIYDRLNEPAYTAPDPGTFPVTVNSGSLGTVVNGVIQPGVNTGVAGVPYTGFGANNRACNFNGVGGYIDVGGAAELELTGPMTVTVWMKGNPADGRFQSILGKGDNSWRVSLDDTGHGHFAVGNSPDASGGRNINDGQWHFLTGVYDGSTVSIYVDGVLDGSVAATGTIVGSGTSATIGTVPDYLTSRVFAGSVDEVAVFDTALTPAQIQQIFNAANAPAMIVQQPPSAVTVFEGAATNLSVVAVGAPTLKYQWLKNGSALTGKTSSSLPFSSILPGDAGNYSVIVTNNYGAVTSSIVALAVQSGPPLILTQPQSLSRYQGRPATFTVTAGGTTPLSYQWYFNGSTPIAGANSSSYSLASVQPVNAGNYSCTITNLYGTTNTVSVALTVLPVPAGAYAAAVLADNPLAYWRVGETNGTIAHDYFGGHDGQYTNVTLGVQGYSALDTNKAIAVGPMINSFVGNITGIDFATTGSTATFTLEAWVKGPPAQSGDVGILTKGTGGGGEQFNLDTGNGGKYRFFIRDTSGNVSAINTSVGPDNTWQHLVAVYDAPAGLMHMYLNGGDIGTVSASANGILTSSHAMSIGSRQSGNTVYDLNFLGTVDEVAVYGTALSADRVLAHYTARYGDSTPAVIATQPSGVTNYVTVPVTFSVDAGGTDPLSYQWKFNGVDIPDATLSQFTIASVDPTNVGNYSVTVSNPFGTTNSTAAHLAVLPAPTVLDLSSGLVLHLKFDGDYADSSGRGNNGTNAGTTTFVAGKIGSGALHYYTDTSSASYNYVQLGLRPDLQFSSNINFSVAFWVRQPAGQSEGDLPFFCNAVGSTYSAGYVIAPSYKSGDWGWSLYNGGNGVGVNGPGGSIATDGNWHHLVHTFDRTGYGTTYLDGAPVDARSIAAVGDVNTGQPTNIGQDPTGTYAESGENDIDDFGVWQRVLTPQEVAAMYAAGKVNGVTFAVPQVKLTIQPVGNQVRITWPSGVLQSADVVTGPYSDVPSATSPYTISPSAAKKFYRVRL